mmetsp:Transcript_29733/g.65464  ORF Transcript_29733/g.65464 Transcript_29733/m.65464 type:complete len:211 (-) Transcript_29733:270-902(-)
MTRLSKRVSSVEEAPRWPSPGLNDMPPRTRMASIRRASLKHSLTTVAFALPVFPRSWGRSVTFRGLPSSKPIASAAFCLPDPRGPQNSAVVPWQLRMVLSKPHRPKSTPRAFSISTMALSFSFTMSLTIISSSPDFGTTLSSKSAICNAPRICFLQPSIMSLSLMLGEVGSRPTASCNADMTAFLMKPPVSSYLREIASQLMSSSHGMAS